MKLYNTLTNKKEEFIPIEPGKVKMYACGPTVYNYIHIGNARPAIIFDVLRRYLEYTGNEVTYVQNFTDIDDKIINRANEENIPAHEVSEKYIKEYFDDVESLGVGRATIHPKVSEHVDDIIELIQKLIDNGKAYEQDGDVFYSVESFPEYGKLSGQNIEELKSGARISVDENKRSPLDFALWKKKKEGEPYWESPWGQGRPGWHIECSAMSTKLLGPTIDIHGGGQDLIFPHHENEIAQSEGANNQPFANYWVHNGYININNEKMSKSLGNFFTVREIREKYDPNIIRLFMLMAHYRSPLNFSEDLIIAAGNALDRLKNAKTNFDYLMDTATDKELTDAESEWLANLPSYKDKYIKAMDDDLNTSDAISVIFELVRDSNKLLSEDSSLKVVEETYSLFKELSNILNILPENDEIVEEDILALIEERQAARKNRDFARADEIRDYLKSQGIELMDTREGVKWKKI